jgi:hypothetical protein
MLRRNESLRADVQDLLLFELLSDAVPQGGRDGYRQLWASLPESERRPCPSCFGTLGKNVPLRELGEENGFRRWRCTGCFTEYYRPPLN